MKDVAKFFSSIQKQPSGCWLWIGSLNKSGYAPFKRTLAHRWSWEHHKGPIPKGICVCHTCDVRNCVNPDHLWLGTHTDNMQDMWHKGRENRGPRFYANRKVRPSRLSDEVVLEIYHRAVAGENQRDLAEEFNIHHATVSVIKLKKSWKNVLKNV